MLVLGEQHVVPVALVPIGRPCVLVPLVRGPCEYVGREAVVPEVLVVITHCVEVDAEVLPAT